MELDILRAELERLFELEELLEMSRTLLGFDPETIGGAAAKGSFANALVRHCIDGDAVEALCDVLFATKPNVDARLGKLRVDGPALDEELKSGDPFGPFNIARKLGEGRLALSYVARKDGKEFRLKILRHEATRDRRGLQRFLTVSRLVGTIDHIGLPRQLAAGEIGGRYYVVHEHVDGQPLSARIARTGPMHVNEARPLLKALLESLAKIHERRLAHGDLRLDNAIVYRTSDGLQHVVLLDAGSDRLRSRPRQVASNQELFSTVGSPKTVAPEQIRGFPADARSDVYAFGAVLYEVLSGKPVFSDATAASELASAHLSRNPAAPSSVAPRGWIGKEIDDFVLSLLVKDPDKRPRSAEALLEAVDSMGRASVVKTQAKINDADLDARIDALVADPESDEAAIALESAVEEGAEAKRVAEAFSMAADQIEVGEDPKKREARKSLLFRAARLWEHGAKDMEKAEQVYVWLVDLDPSDDIAVTALEDARRQLGKYEELVEMLLARSESAPSRTERARALSEIGRLYASELDDKEQALVAYCQAFCEDAHQSTYADEIEKVAGSSPEAWNEVLSTCGTALSSDDLPPESKNLLLARVGRWYSEKVSRADLALPCYQAILQTEPANEAALEGMTAIYKKAQQWVELGMVLTRRADAAAPARARDLRTEAADILEVQLSDTGRARALYEQVLVEDPGHGKAGDALGRIYERIGEWPGFVKILERRAESLRGEEKQKALCKIAEVQEDRLKDDVEATRRYAAVLDIAPDNLDALRGLDRLYSKSGRFGELLLNLRSQVQIAATPRQKITLWERIAGVHDEEFLDHEKAAGAWEEILKIDGAHEEALTSLVRHYRALDRWEDVASLYERHLKLITEPARSIDLCLALARVLSDQVGSPERATAAYERVLELDPSHASSMEALAKLRETSGDADAAVAAIEALADKATTPLAKAEQWVRAARLLEGRGDRDGAIDRYKRALDANPTDAGASLSLRAAYIARGDTNAAIQLLEREIDREEGESAKAKLAAEIATLAREKLKDDGRADEAAKRAITYDPTNIEALGVLGDMAFEGKRYIEAAHHYEQLAERADTLEKTAAARVLVRYVDALSQTGSTEKALTAMDTLQRIAPDDAAALERVAQVTFEHGSAKRAVDLYKDLMERFGSQIAGKERALNLYRFGEALRRTEAHDEAAGPLEEATDLDPGFADPLAALAKVYEAKERWEDAIKIKTRHLDLADGEGRITLLIEIGDIASGKLNDRTRAAKSFVAALDERPDDRRLLTKLMQLYSEEKDWGKLIDVVLRLADFVDDKKQKSKYLHTAAGIASRQMGDVDRALEFFERVLDLDPDNEKALDEAIDAVTALNRHQEVERWLKRKLERAAKLDEKPKMLTTFVALGELYEKHLGLMDQAIDAFEAAQTFDPDNRVRGEHLANLYASDPARYLEKAVVSQVAILRQNPHRAEAYKLLRRLYTEVKRADAAWCLCQALYCLNLAEPDEERFYKRMRSESAAPASAALDDQGWLDLLMHVDADPLLTGILALIEPAVILARSQALTALGYDPRYAIDLARHPYPMSQTLHYACGVLGMQAPLTFENTNDPGGLSFLHAHSPSIVLGVAALSADVPPQAGAFIAARHLTYFRPGMYVRHLVPTGTGLKSWLFAAIKLIVPQFPIAADLEGPVVEAQKALETHLTPTSKDHLARIVSRLLQAGGALDLKKWVAGVDLTADRAGFVIAHDLETAVEIIRASDEGSSAVPAQERLKELVLYAVSEPYFRLRERCGITIDA